MATSELMAPWVPLFQSSIEAELTTKDNKPPFTTFQFATIDQNGFPHNRTVVYRGFLFDMPTTNVITFSTDKRMSKYNELEHNDLFEAVFYLSCVKKQFRFRGRARIIDDNYKPKLDLSVLEKLKVIGQDVDNVELNSGMDRSASKDRGVLSDESSFIASKNRQPQLVSLKSTLISPNLTNSVHSLEIDLSSLLGRGIEPPTEEEWDMEIRRQWAALSKNLRRSFKNPPPKAPFTDENQKLLDSIKRGVDGMKEDHGFKNFSLVGLFIDYADYVDVEKDRRYLFQLQDDHQWKETDICP